MKLTAEERNALSPSAFAIPSERKYPIVDKSHARNALARVSHFGTKAEKRAVCHAVARRFPDIHESSCSLHRAMA